MSLIIELTSGKKVANFSSPHSFTFTDGTVLPAVTAEDAERLKVTFHENIDSNGDVELSFSLSSAVMAEVYYWQKNYKEGLVDVVFIPLPMLTALREANYNVKNSPFRVVRIEDRIRKLVSCTKQCL